MHAVTIAIGLDDCHHLAGRNQRLELSIVALNLG